MALSGKQSPLGVNSLAGLLNNEGIQINPIAKKQLGTSKTNDNYTPGAIVNVNCLRNLTYAINDAFKRGQPGSTGTMANCYIEGTTLTVGTLNSGYIQTGMTLTGTGVTGGTTIVSKISGEGTGSKWTVSISQTVKDITITGNMPSYTVNNSTYTNLLQIGQSRIPALGNSKPPTYIANDPSGVWKGEATTGYAIPGPTGQGQKAKWTTWDANAENVSVTQWGWLRLLALQAYNEFNYNGDPEAFQDPYYTPNLKSYAQTFLTYNGFLQQSNQVITTMRNSKDFAKGTYSNMNDMITADISGVSVSAQAFGQDLINLGRVLNLPRIENFGLPSTLLQVMQQYSAVSPGVAIALVTSGMQQNEIDSILLTGQATPAQEKLLYNAFTIVTGQDLAEVLQVMRVTTKGITTLADLLSVKKLFPISRGTLTVPIYNISPGPTNSKTYYLLFIDDEMNPQLVAPAVEAQVQVIVPPPLEKPEEPTYPVLPIETVINTDKQAIINAPPAVVPQVVERMGGDFAERYSPINLTGGGKYQDFLWENRQMDK